MILYINACVREESRTNRIALELLKRLGGQYCEIRLAEEKIHPLTTEKLQKRTELIAKKDYNDTMFAYAKQFALADEIMIAAPYWDLSFPAALKVYLENIYVTGIVSEYSVDGVPHGLCKAKTLYYVTTAGGPYLPDYSYNYIKSLATVCFGIKQAVLIKAEMLDVQGLNADEIVEQAICGLSEILKKD